MAVQGNQDDAELQRQLPIERVVEAENARIGMVHDGGPKDGRLRRMRRRFPDADAVVFGHSHIPLHEQDDGFQIFNPGSPTDRRRAPTHTMGLAHVSGDQRPVRARRGRLTMDLDVLFLGTAASAPTARRGLPATLIRRGGEKLLVDCGEGTQRQLVRSVGLVDIDDLFITHFHADHVLGIPGLLKTYGLQARERRLRVYGPAGLERLFKSLAPLIGRLPFEIQLTELDAGEELPGEGYRLTCFNVDHGVSALGYALVEDERPGRFDQARAQELGVAPGPDYGRLQAGETVNGVTPDQVLGPARPGRRVVLAGDGAPCEMTAAEAQGADLLVHEATFMTADAPRARETRHSTAEGAARLAAEAGVKLLALTHISSRYYVRDLVAEAKAEFDSVIVPRDFDRVELPFPESGSPSHIRGDTD